MSDMKYLHVINIEKHNPNYKDRKSIWLKYHFSANNDHGFSRLCDIDKWRFFEFMRLEIQTKKPVIIDNEYLKKQGFNLSERRIVSTINQLIESKLVEIKTRTEAEQDRNSGRTAGEQRENSGRTEVEQEPGYVDTKGLKTKSVTQSRVEKSRVYKNKHIAKMTPPTFEELSQYIHEKRYQVNAQDFFDKYENENPPWSNNKGKPMTSWKSTLVTWNGNAQKNTQPSNRIASGVAL